MSQPDSGPQSIVGLFHQLEPPGVIVGRQIAVDEFTRALLKHGQRHRYALYVSGRRAEELAKRLGDDAARVSIHDRRELAWLTGADFTAWHEPQFGTYAPFALRARAKSPWPITLLHHSLSYKNLLHDELLPLLLAGPHSYDALVTTSTAAEQALRRLIEHVAGAFNAEHGTALTYRGRYERIPLGVDTDRFRPRDRASARKHFEIDADAFVLLWIGRLSAIDKADLLPLVQGFADLSRNNAGRKLRLVCAGSDRPSDRLGAVLTNFANHLGVGQSVVVMADGDRVNQIKEELYAAADVFVSPVDNVQESFGLTPIEAMACGIPQVVSDWNGYRDSVVDGGTGFLVPTVWAGCQSEINASALVTESAYDHLVLSQSVAVDMRALSRCVQRLIDEPTLRESMAARSRQRAEERYSWPVVIRSYETLWSELCDQAKRAPEPLRDGCRYASPDYGRCFGHFASRNLDENSALRLTAHGRDVAAKRADLPGYYIDIWQHLDLALLDRVLVGLKRADERGATLTIGRILAVMTTAGASQAVRDIILRHVLFLIKYGLAEEVGPHESTAAS